MDLLEVDQHEEGKDFPVIVVFLVLFFVLIEGNAEIDYELKGIGRRWHFVYFIEWTEYVLLDLEMSEVGSKG